MRKRIKKIIALSAAAALSLGSLRYACTRVSAKEGDFSEQISQADGMVSATSENNDVKNASEHLLVLWSDYLRVLDQMYASELWALDYVDAYLESGDWKELTKARTACIASARYLTELSMTEEDLSEEEYLTLAGAGIDTGYQTIEILSLADALEEAHLVIRKQLLQDLEGGIFYESSVETMKEQVALQREYIACMCRYTCNETNYLLLSLGDNVMSDAYWSSMQENYPALSIGCTDWIDTEAELKALEDAYLDEYEEIILKHSELLSGMNADLYRMKQIIQNGELEKLMESVYSMTNVPELLPIPEWYNPEYVGYLSFIAAEDGSVVYPESGDELPDANYGMYIQITDISEEEIEDYINTVKDTAQLAWKGENSSSWYIAMSEYQVKIDLEGDTATCLFSGEDITFAPIWYIACL